MTPAYSPIQHLADSVFLNHDPNQRFFLFMTDYTAYLDASGAQDTAMMSVGGFISNVNDWKSFENDWKRALARAKVPYFHMKKFTVHKAPFDNMKWRREEYRKEFLSALIDTIARNVDFFVVNILRISDWEHVNKEFCMREAQLTPFAVAGCGALLGVEEWCRQHGVPWNHMKIIIEDGDLNKGDFMHWSKKTFKKTIIPMPGVPDNDEPEEDPFTPLQACDFLAWEARRAETDVEANPEDYDMRKCFDALLDRIPSDDGHEKWNINNLRSLCNTHGIKKR
jgi:hypothetical protein